MGQGVARGLAGRDSRRIRSSEGRAREGRGSQGATRTWPGPARPALPRPGPARPCPALPGPARPCRPRALCSRLQLVHLVSHSYLGRLSSKGCFHRLSSQDSPGEACKTASARVCQPCGKPVEGAPLTTTPALSLALLTQRTLPLASTLPAEPPSALTRTPLGPFATSSALAHSCFPSTNSGHGRTSCRIEFLSKSVRIFGYFAKIFDYGSHFSFSPGSLRN